MKNKIYFALVFVLICACIALYVRYCTHGDMYPDARLTPGDVFPDVGAAEVCVSGYTASVRDVSEYVRKEVFAEYGIRYPPPPGKYELDHFIPLELGGSNDKKNLWVEEADPRPGFHEKDHVENYLHHEVCVAKSMTLKEAQERIRKDWYAVYKTLPLPKRHR